MLNRRTTGTPTGAEANGHPKSASAQDSTVPVEVRAGRRLLLKAAASAAPLIATLPSGEALANASALQCVINQQTGGNDFPLNLRPHPNTDPQDKYTRQLGSLDLYRIPDPRPGATPGATIVVRINKISELPPGTGEITVYGDNSALNIPAVPPMGSWFDTTNPLHVRIGGVQYQFLVVYGADRSPIQDPSDVAVSNLVPTDCEINSSIPTWPGTATVSGPSAPQHCFYPLAVQVPANTPGNIPLTTSCLASFG
jgi:hypothetical protein